MSCGDYLIPDLVPKAEADFWRQKYFELVEAQTKIALDLINNTMRPVYIPDRCPKCGHKFQVPKGRSHE